MKPDDISFDESYKNLFQVDDARLRAEALKHSVVPRLRAVLNECIDLVGRVYGVDALKDSRISWFPQFREKRVNELDHFYDSAYASLSGKQDKEKWKGLNRKDGKPVQLLPFRYGLMLEADGIQVLLENYWVKGLTDESHHKLFNFHLEYESLIHRLCYYTEIEPTLYFGEGCEPISTFKEHYEWMAQNRFYDNFFTSKYYKYPVTSEDLYGVVESYVVFYPVYDSYLRIAKGEDVRFLEMLEKLNHWIRQVNGLHDEAGEPSTQANTDTIEQARAAAEQKIRVMPALRWQVFQRDGWKCVACGRGSHDDVILHVDHIVPRSKGGKDTLENYQTLCDVCNIGKSNKDTTNLRRD